MRPKENQYFRDNQMYTISSSTLLATDDTPQSIVRVYTQLPREEPEAPKFLYRNVDGEYFLIEDDSTPPVLPLNVDGARYWFKKLPKKMMSEVEAFGDSKIEASDRL